MSPHYQLMSNRALTHLDVSWNYICKDSAFQLGNALRFNTSLKHLNLCHNSFSDMPAQQLADSLACYPGTLAHVYHGSYAYKLSLVYSPTHRQATKAYRTSTLRLTGTSSLPQSKPPFCSSENHHPMTASHLRRPWCWQMRSKLMTA